MKTKKLQHSRFGLPFWTILWLVLDKYNLFDGIILGVYFTLLGIWSIIYLYALGTTTRISLNFDKLDKDGYLINKEKIK